MSTAIAEYRVIRKCWDGSDPSELLPGEMHVFYDAEVPVFVDFLCPCGCSRTCPTRVCATQEEHDRRKKEQPSVPVWIISIKGDVPTLYPSVRWTSGCKWHFNITDGKVIVAGDSGK